MTPELLLVLALLSLAASVAFAYMAYRVWRKKQPEESAEPPGSEPEALPPEPEATPLPAKSPETGAAAVASSLPTASAPSVPPAVPAHERVIPVATLLRDEVTGGLVVRVGDREYRTAKELLASKDRQRMEYTAAELRRWLGAEKAASSLAAAEPAGKPAAPRRPMSMVEQINEILDQKLVERPQLKRGVRLAEGPGGAIKVYIGIDSYNAIDDVPDADIRQLIRDAVAEWETGQ